MQQQDPSLDRNAKFYEKYDLFKYYDDYMSCETGIYQHLVSNWELNIIRGIVQSCDSRRILLVGLGFGRELDSILKISSRLQVNAIDFNQGFISPARSIYSSNKVSFHCADLNSGKMLFADSEFDLIVCLNTLEYLNGAGFDAFFDEAFRVLNPGGKLFFRLYNSSFPFFFFDRRHLNRRSSEQPMLYPRPFMETVRLVEKKFVITKLFSQGFQINMKLFKYFYSNGLAYITWKTEFLMAKAIPTRYARNVYFVTEKT